MSETLTYPARVIAGRYELVAPLGRGGFGTVWDAKDRLTGEPVAVKLLDEVSPGQLARVRREVAALRLLDLPGVVRLLDEGADDQQLFLVMERVQGRPFPGVSGAVPWIDIATTVLALFETLARVHVAGVVHRDLKPANVLVMTDGRPVLLDFGLAYMRAPVEDALTRDGEMLGTAEYLAPEQINGDLVTPRTDLYSMGVLLYGALSGRLPHEARDLQGLLRARLIRRPTPLADRAPSVPLAVAEIVDQLLAVDPAERPRSAAEVISRLRGEPVLAAPQIPRLGPHSVVDSLVAAALEGRTAYVSGQPGSGRTRCLQDVAEVLRSHGRRVVWTCVGRRALSSLQPLLGLPSVEDEAPLAEVLRQAEDGLRRVLSEGAVLIVDDPETLDHTSTAVLDTCGNAGPVVRASNTPPTEGSLCVTVQPLTEDALGALFAGPRRILHLRDDAARALHARTDGIPARVVDELTAWERARLVQRNGDQWSIDRDAIDALESGVRPASWASLELPSMPPHLEEILDWIVLAWPHANADLLPRAMGQPRWRVEAELLELLACGAARRRDDGRLDPRVASRIEERWSPERRKAAHQALSRALEPGSPGRLLHLMAGGDELELEHADAIAREAALLARRLIDEGRLRKATAALAAGLRVVRRSSAGLQLQDDLLSLWTEVALAESSSHAIDQLLYELSRTNPRSERLVHLESLARAATAFSAGGERGLDAARAVKSFDEVGLERRRLHLLVTSARRCSVVKEEAAVQEVTLWAERAGHEGTASLAAWQGRLRYRQGRFEEAARLHAMAADLATWPTERVFERLAAASSAMEAFHLDRAASWAREALEIARDWRHAYFEARAEWLIRAIAYRACEPLEPDIELVDATRAVQMGDLEALVSLTEAAFAFRRDLRAACVDLASRAHKKWSALGMHEGARFARCLAVRCGSEVSVEEARTLLAWAQECDVPGLGLQALALLIPQDGSVALQRGVVERLASQVSPERWDVRMDVLSVKEALEGVRQQTSS